jgi:ATP/maltotriose-dependent transcriptional regulator MalT
MDEESSANLGKLLSRRELEVLGMVADGHSNREIASSLHLSIHAVKFHLASTYRKLNVMNRTEAAVAYLRDTPREGPRSRPAVEA